MLIFIFLFFNLLFLCFENSIARNKAHQEIYIDINANKLNNVRLIGLKTKKTNDIIYNNFKFCKTHSFWGGRIWQILQIVLFVMIHLFVLMLVTVFILEWSFCKSISKLFSPKTKRVNFLFSIFFRG